MARRREFLAPETYKHTEGFLPEIETSQNGVTIELAELKIEFFYDKKTGEFGIENDFRGQYYANKVAKLKEQYDPSSTKKKRPLIQAKLATMSAAQIQRELKEKIDKLSDKHHVISQFPAHLFDPSNAFCWIFMAVRTLLDVDDSRHKNFKTAVYKSVKQHMKGEYGIETHAPVMQAFLLLENTSSKQIWTKQVVVDGVEKTQIMRTWDAEVEGLAREIAALERGGKNRALIASYKDMVDKQRQYRETFQYNVKNSKFEESDVELLVNIFA